MPPQQQSSSSPPHGRRSLAAELASEHPADIAERLGTLPVGRAWSLLKSFGVERRAEIFGYLAPELQQALAAHASAPLIAAVVTEMHADDRADFFQHLPADQRDVLLRALAQTERENIRQLAIYEEGSTGAIMTSDYAALPMDVTAGAALEKLRYEAPDKETIYRAYVTDATRALKGVVTLKDIILADPKTPIASIMEEKTHAVRVDADQEHVAQQIAKYDILAIPVVDGQDRLVGIVTHDDAMDVLQEEATEDFHKVGTIGKITEKVRDVSAGVLYRKRITWLLLLVFANLFSGAGIALFEDLIAANIALVFFLPLLVDSGGNAGSQAATLMVRALATGDVRPRDWAHMLGKEIFVAAGLGATMALAVSGIGWVRGGPEVALVVSLAMVAVVMTGSLVGVSLPFILGRANLDPATASSPLVTSIADASGVLIYFSIASRILLDA